MRYLNPFSLLDIDVNDAGGPDPQVIRGAKKRLFAEFDLDGQVIRGGRPVSKSDALRALDELDDIDKRRFHLAVYKEKRLLGFLTSGSLELFVDSPKGSTIEDDGFVEFISPWFANQYDKVLFDSVRNGDLGKARTISKKLPLVANSYLDMCYESTYRYLKDKLQSLQAKGEEIEKGQLTQDAKLIGKDVEAEVVPDMVNALPKYFGNIRNDLANVLRNISVEIHNKLGETRVAVSILSRACAIHTYGLVKDRVSDDLAKLHEMLEKEDAASRCWFCGERKHDESADWKTAFFKVTDWSEGKIHYLRRTAVVPRCGRCRVVHYIGTICAFLLSCCGFILGASCKEVFLPTLVGLIVGLEIGIAYRKWMKTRSRYDVLTHPSMVVTVNSGWEYGDGPDGSSNIITLIAQGVRSVVKTCYRVASNDESFLSVLDSKGVSWILLATIVLSSIGLMYDLGNVKNTNKPVASVSTNSDRITPETNTYDRAPSASENTSYSSTNTPALTVPAVRKENQQSLWTLREEIEQGKTELSRLEPLVKSLNSSIDNYDREIKTLKASIDRMERNSALGYSVDQAEYNSAINEHNTLVARHNEVLRRYRLQYADYQRILNKTNEKVEQYNRQSR